MGSLREGEKERVGGGIPRGVGAGRNKKKFGDIAERFAVEKAHRDRNV